MDINWVYLNNINQIILFIPLLTIFKRQLIVLCYLGKMKAAHMCPCDHMFPVSLCASLSIYTTDMYYRVASGKKKQ